VLLGATRLRRNRFGAASPPSLNELPPSPKKLLRTSRRGKPTGKAALLVKRKNAEIRGKMRTFVDREILEIHERQTRRAKCVSPSSCISSISWLNFSLPGWALILQIRSIFITFASRGVAPLGGAAEIYPQTFMGLCSGFSLFLFGMAALSHSSRYK